MVRAEGFAALALLAFTVVSLGLVGVVDRSVTVRATDGVAVHLVLSAREINTKANQRLFSHVQD